eukprot:1844095-Alexandrium_andersonii.AAC.1
MLCNCSRKNAPNSSFSCSGLSQEFTLHRSNSSMQRWYRSPAAKRTSFGNLPRPERKRLQQQATSSQRDVLAATPPPTNGKPRTSKEWMGTMPTCGV